MKEIPAVIVKNVARLPLNTDSIGANIEALLRSETGKSHPVTIMANPATPN